MSSNEQEMTRLRALSVRPTLEEYRALAATNPYKGDGSGGDYQIDLQRAILDLCARLERLAAMK